MLTLNQGLVGGLITFWVVVTMTVCSGSTMPAGVCCLIRLVLLIICCVCVCCTSNILSSNCTIASSVRM